MTGSPAIILNEQEKNEKPVVTTIFAVANQKGGVGKTTTSINLAASLAKMQRRVLLVDLDPQGNATMGSGVDKNTLIFGTYEVLTHQCPIRKAIVNAEPAGYAVLPSNGDLTAAEVELLEVDGKESRMRSALAEVAVDYDYILIDCPPSLNMLTLNGLVAADAVLIPMQCEYYALEGLSALSNTIAAIQQAVNPRLRIEGIIRTMFDPRNNLTMQVSEQLRQHFGDNVYRTVIPRNIRLAEAPSHGLPVIVYDKASTGAQAYLALAGEVLRRGEPQAAASTEQLSSEA